MEITKDSILADILKKDGAESILEKFSLPCLHCPMARFEIEKLKIGEVCKAYGIDLKNLLAELNKDKTEI